MDRAIEIAVTYETTQQHVKSMATGMAAADTVGAIKKHKRHPNRCHSRDEHTDMLICRNCGGMHEKKIQLSAENAYYATSEIIGPRYASWRKKTGDQSQRQSTPLTEQKMNRLFTLTPSPVGKISRTLPRPMLRQVQGTKFVSDLTLEPKPVSSRHHSTPGWWRHTLSGQA